jgi:hypothetical protein
MSHFTPESGHWQCKMECPLWANNGTQRQENPNASAKRRSNASYSICFLRGVRRRNRQEATQSITDEYMLLGTC